MVPKRGEGGTLTGGVSGSSGVMVLLAGSKNWTLVGVEGAIMTVWVVKGKSGGVGRSGSGGSGGWPGDGGGAEESWTSGRGLYIRTSQRDKWI